MTVKKNRTVPRAQLAKKKQTQSRGQASMPFRVFILGAGKVGRALAAAARRSGFSVRLRAARDGLPRAVIFEEFVILAVRDGEIEAWAARLADRIPFNSVCVHTAGSKNADFLNPLRVRCSGVAQMHPMISFASRTQFPSLDRGNLHVQGDPKAVQRAKTFGRRIGMTARTIANLDPVGYHAAAGLVANGAAALAAMGALVLESAGVPANEACKLLGPLLRSVAENVEKLGFPDALTGPVRRGDADAVAKHASVLTERLPAVLPLYLAAVAAQVPIAKQLGEAPSKNFDAIFAFATR
jgi:predicted short-subunit dehydrogenase-like oxidoreductase (DUF2520 family)